MPAIRALVQVAVAAWLLAAPAVARADLEVAMYDPDANLANVGRLRTTMTSFLRTIDRDARFTAFTRLADLRRHLQDRRVDFLIIAPEAASELGLELRTVMVPIRGDSADHHRVLLVRKGTRGDDIKIVATTGSSREVEAIAIPGRSRGARKPRVLRVTKGFDALLGLTFQRADAAYVTPETLAELARVDRALAEGLVEIYRSPPIPNAPLAVVTRVDRAVIERMAAAFAAMDKSETGRATLKLLDYSGWREP